MEKKAQIWVSVVIYTLVGIAAIGLLLMVLQPRINEARDGITIKQTIEALHNFDSALRSTLIAPGNIRQVDFKLSKGELLISSPADKISWSMQSAKKYSEIGIAVQEGTITVLTEEGNPYKVTLTLNYAGISDITFNAKEEEKLLAKSGKPYIISIENLGKGPGELLQQVNIKVRA